VKEKQPKQRRMESGKAKGAVGADTLAKLKTLSLVGTKVSDLGLSRLRHLSMLEQLWLNNTKITDAGLIHLKGLTKLFRLDLRGTSITDASSKTLSKMPSLHELNLPDQVGYRTIEEIKRNLPRACTITWKGKNY